jgi:hypothetical protein
MKEADSPSSIFIDFSVPARAPRLSWTETALQLSENITLFAIYGIHKSVIDRGPDKQLVLRVSFVYILYNVGDRTGPTFL